VLYQLAGWMPVLDEAVDVVAWVPASRNRRRQRGYDQGRVLARHAGRRLGVGHRRLLARPRRDAQAGRSRSDRLAGPLLVATGRCPPRILLVDDVSTTGASLANAAAVLRRAGARYVAAGVLAAVEHRSGAAAVPPSRARRSAPQPPDRLLWWRRPMTLEAS
jgi:predicted amidophosphoribosyltransferase